MLTQTMLTQTPLLRWASQQPVEHRELEEASDTSLGLSAPNTIKTNKTTAKCTGRAVTNFLLRTLVFAFCFLKSGDRKVACLGEIFTPAFSRMCRRKLVLLRSEP